MSSNAKDIRKQLRNVIQEEIENILTQELTAKIYQDLLTKMQKQLAEVSKVVKDTLDRIDERSKNIQTYTLNQSSVVTPPILAPIKKD